MRLHKRVPLNYPFSTIMAWTDEMDGRPQITVPKPLVPPITAAMPFDGILHGEYDLQDHGIKIHRCKAKTQVTAPSIALGKWVA